MQTSIINRIEQRMKRGVRSNQEHCIVFFFWKKFSWVIICRWWVDKFSITTKKELELSDKISTKLKDKDAYYIFNNTCEYHF